MDFIISETFMFMENHSGAFRNIIFGVAVLIAAFALLPRYITGSAAKNQAAISGRSHKSEKFSEAVRGLEANLPSERFGAVHMLSMLSEEDDQDLISILHVLAAHVRRHCPSQNSSNAEGAEEIGSEHEISIDIHESLKTISKINKRILQNSACVSGLRKWFGTAKKAHSLAAELEERPVDLSNTDLSGLELDSPCFDRVLLQNSILKKCVFRNISLVGANLSGSDLEKAYMLNGDFQSVNLRDSNLTNTNLRGANLQRSNLCSAQMDNCSLGRANLESALLWGACLRGASLVGTIFQGAQLCEADLETAIYLPQCFDEACTLGAKLNSSTTRPDNLTA